MALVFGAWLRFSLLGEPEVFCDEGMAVATQYQSVHQINQERIDRRPDINIEPPGYHIVNKYYTAIVPDSGAALKTVRGRFYSRLLSALAGVVSIFFMFLLARLFVDRRWAWLPALLLAFSFYAVYYSQQNRPYSLVMMLSLAATCPIRGRFVRSRSPPAPRKACAPRCWA